MLRRLFWFWNFPILKWQIRKGTQQEIQTVAVTKADTNDVHFVLEFEGETTGPILAHDSASCDSTQSEVQKISTSTSGERSREGGGGSAGGEVTVRFEACS